MRAGELKHRIEILAPAEGAADAYGRRATGWNVYKTAMAKISDVSGREFYEAAAYQMEDVVSYTIRYDAHVSSDMRIRRGGAIYEILQINHLGYMRDYMTIKARSIRREGT